MPHRIGVVAAVVCAFASHARAQAPAAPAEAAKAPEGSKLTLSLALDKAAYALGDEASAEVRLENAGEQEASVLDLQLEARSLTLELVYDGKEPALKYTVHRPALFYAYQVGPNRLRLAPKRALAAVVPVPLVRGGKVTMTAVYRGASGAGGAPAPEVRSGSAGAEVKADAGKVLVAKIEAEIRDPNKPSSDKGTFVVRMDAERAPLHVMNFLFLARQGFYDGRIFFRVAPEFAQTGCPMGNGWGDPGYNIDSEHKPEQKHVRGAVSMSHPAGAGNENAAGSQFFVCIKDCPWLDLPGENFTVFGSVVKGIEFADQIGKVETDAKTCKPLRGAVTVNRVSITVE